ncbi:hypothetical protein HY449_03760 [Candidatus Pacearchaeota archaeon]|nr:hypothetical protein [Candidatus Pacearchaeota archaeon]
MGIFNIFKGREEKDLENKDVTINYQNLIKKYSWIIEENQNVILSPDSDGFLCGLLMSHFFNWKIVGYYDGKILILRDKLKAKDCIFLDMEIFRKEIRSLGQHMLLFNKKDKPSNWNNLDNCIQANNLREYDAKNNFPLKYPFGSIHLLLGIIGSIKEIEVKESAICPLLYTDGTFKNLFNYPENCLSWLEFLGANKGGSPLNKLFFNSHYTISSLMIALREFFGKLKEINGGKRGGDKLKISDSSGKPINLVKSVGIFSINNEQKKKIINLLKILKDLTGWEFIGKNWTFDNFSIYRFKKGTIVPSNKRFKDLLNKNPLSWAMTSSLAIEYTLEKPDKLP